MGESPVSIRLCGVDANGVHRDTIVNTTTVDIKLVLIDQDIEGVIEYDPAELVDESDILTPEEIGEGIEVIFQDPPDEDYDENHVDLLNLWGYKRRRLSLKYFVTKSVVVPGTADAGGPSTITLDSSASDIDSYYNDDSISLTDGTGSGQTAMIVAYDGTTKVATVDVPWSTEPDNTTDYEITSQVERVLATTVVDDTDSSEPRKIVRYATTTVYYDDGEDFERGEYDVSYYPDYPENAVFPPEGLPEGYLKKRYRGLAINNVLITALCHELPAPPLPEED